MTDSIHAQFAIVALMLLLSLLLGLCALVINRKLAPKERTSREHLASEHGGRTLHKTWIQFRVRYALFALLFVAFDMEMVFMFPWAVVFKRIGLVAFLDMFVFIAILTAAIVFAWKEGAFDWER